MKRFTYVLAASLLFIAVSFNTAFAANQKNQQHWGTPYSIAYLTKNHKLAEANKAFSNATVYFNISLPQNTRFIYWTVTFEDGTNTYTLNTDPYGFNFESYYDHQWSGSIPEGTYTVTIHNQSSANNYLFDAVIIYTDANGQGQSNILWDKNTDNTDFVFQNVHVPSSNNSIDINLSAHP